MHTFIFADGALGAKNARDCSQKQYFDAGMERPNGDRNGQKSEKSKYNCKQCSYRDRLGVKIIIFLVKIAWSRFAKMLSPLEQEQHFWKNVMQKVSWNMKSIKEAVWSLHFWCIFVSWSVENKFFCFLLGTGYCFCKVTKSALGSFLGGRAECAGALGGDVRGVCDLQIEIGILIFALWVRHAVPCLRQGRRIAPRIPPGQLSGTVH